MTAIKSQGAVLAVSTAAGAAKTVTGATVANPVVVTATAHGFTNGAIVVISGIAGMTQLNGRAFVVANQTTNTFELKGIDGTSYTAYTSGGTATPQTMTAVSQTKNMGGFDGQAAEIDTTHLASTAKEFMLGLQDFGQYTLALIAITDVGQAKLRSLKAAAAVGYFSVTLSDGTVAAFAALVKQYSLDSLQPDSAVANNVTLRVTGEPAWFA